jgi:hypothetical protein
VRVHSLQDGKPLPSNEAGVDIQFDSRGSYLEVSNPRMYYLMKNPAFGSHLLVLEPEAPVQALMRHANASVTMGRYVQAVKPAKREAQSRIVASIPFRNVPARLTESAATA